MAGVAVVETGLDEGDTGVAGCGVRQGWADARPGAVGADHQVGVLGGAIVEEQAPGAVLERGGPGDGAAPPDGALGEGFQEQAAQLAAVDLRAVVVAGPLDGQGGGGDGVDHTPLLAFGAGHGAEPVEQASRAQSDLTGVRMYVEASALGAGAGGSLTFEDGDGAAVELQDAR